jgi:hypothetical protein
MDAYPERHLTGRFNRCTGLWRRRRDRIRRWRRWRQLGNNYGNVLRHRDWDRCSDRKDHSPNNGDTKCQLNALHQVEIWVLSVWSLALIGNASGT